MVTRALSSSIPRSLQTHTKKKLEKKITSEFLPKGLGFHAPWVARVYNAAVEHYGDSITHVQVEDLYVWSASDETRPVSCLQPLYDDWTSVGGDAADFALYVKEASKIWKRHIDDVDNFYERS